MSDVVVHRPDLGKYEEDVLAEILARLPVRSLLRFRCVCKSWRALISNSYFVSKHLGYTQSYKLNIMLDPPLFLDLEALKTIRHGDDDDDARVRSAVTQMDFPVTQTFPHPGYRNLVGSCNGLLCVEVGLDAIMLWNPCTRHLQVLPKPPRVIESDVSYCFYGFGYDSASDDYKVIRGFTSSEVCAQKFMIHIFALKAGSWRTVQGIDFVTLATWQGLFLNGALHWLCDLSNGDSEILCFDLGAEKFHKTMALPYDGRFCYPLVHKNCLCVVTLPAGTQSLNIWMMREYGVKESWTEAAQFSFMNQNPNFDYREYFRPVCILENGLLVIDANGLSEQLSVLFNLEDKTIGRVVVMEDLWFSTVIYRETLVSPDVHTDSTNINFSSKEDTIFCGVFDGHGPSGLPLKVSSWWVLSSSTADTYHGGASIDSKEKHGELFTMLKDSFLKAFKVMDKELKLHHQIDCYCCGTTAVTLVKQVNVFSPIMARTEIALTDKLTG